MFKPDLESLILDLRKRGSRQRQQSFLVLFAIVIAIGCGIWIFIRAESFGQLAELEKSISSLESTVKGGLWKNRDNIEASMQFLEGREVSPLNFFEADIRNATVAVEHLMNELHELRGSAAFQPESRFETYLISTLSARIGIVLLLVFFVQILMSIYRQSALLAGVCEMQADALSARLCLPESTLEQLEAFFANQKVEFGSAPKAPSEALQQTLKDTVAVIGRAAPKKG